MPKIPTLTQTDRLQVSSPVPIGSSQAARVPGDAIQGFGQDLQRSGFMIAEFAQAAKRTSDSLTVADTSEDAQAAALAAKDEVEKTSDPKDYIQDYDKKIADKMAPTLKGITDPEVLAKAQVAIKQQRNALAGSVYASATRNSVQQLAEKDQQVTSKMIANIDADPSIDNVKLKLGEVNARLDADTALYSPGIKEKKRLEVSQAISTSAVDSLMNSDKYGEAKATLKDLSENFSPKEIQDKLNEIDKRDLQHQDRVLRDSHEAERKGTVANKERGIDLTNQYLDLIENAKTPEEKALAVTQAQKDRNNGILTISQSNMIQRQAFTSVKNEYNPFLADFTRRLLDVRTNKVDLEADVQEKMGAGEITREQGKTLLDTLAVRRADTRNNQALANKYQISDGYIIGKEKDLKNIPFSGGYEDAKASIIAKKDAYLKSGLDPITASQKAMQAVVPKPEALPPIPGYNKGQNTKKELAAAEEFVTKRAKQISKMSADEAAVFNSQMKAYLARKAASEIHPEERKR